MMDGTARRRPRGARQAVPRMIYVNRTDHLGPSLPDHHHETWVLILYLEGRGTFSHAGRAVPFARGTIIGVPPRLVYAETAPGGFRGLWLACEHLRPDEQLVVARDEADRPFERTATLLLEEYRGRLPGWEAACVDGFAALRRWLDRLAPRVAAAHPLGEALRRLLHERATDPGFRLAHAALLMSTSPRHLRRAFVAATGRSPQRYLTDLRVEEARRLLALGGFSVKQVAARCGFADPYYFSRAFSAALGISPSRYASERRL